MKKCPFCYVENLDEAIRCPHCWSYFPKEPLAKQPPIKDTPRERPNMFTSNLSLEEINQIAEEEADRISKLIDISIQRRKKQSRILLSIAIILLLLALRVFGWMGALTIGIGIFLYSCVYSYLATMNLEKKTGLKTHQLGELLDREESMWKLKRMITKHLANKT